MIVVESGTDQVEAALNGGKFPVPADVAADNARQAAKKEGKEPDPVIEAQKAIDAENAKKAEAKTEDTDDVEGDDGLTPRQKREFTKSMLATIAKKHRAQKEAEEFATSQFNSKTAAEQRASDLAKENAELKSKLAPPPKEAELKVPAREDFKDDQTYWDAMVDYRVEKKLQVAEAAAAKQREAEYEAQVIATATERVNIAKELVPDFSERCAEIDTEIPLFVAAHMRESEMIGELTYYFATHADELPRLDKFTRGVKEGTRAYSDAVRKQLVELGKIESKLTPFAKAKADDAPEASQTKSTNGVKAEPETGSAPSKPRPQAPIITPLNGGSASQVERDEADLTGSQVITRWQKKHGVTLTARKRH
jgi:hypothetical protein